MKMERLPPPPAARASLAPPSAGDEFAALVEALRDPRCYPHPVAAVEKVETHISVVLLAGDYAYKLKKPVRLPFLDFTDALARRRFCEEELRLNRRTAAAIYLDVVGIAGPAWAPRVGGAGAAIEHAVRMRRFPQRALAARLAARGAFDASLAEALADRVAGFHALAARLSPPSDLATPERVSAAALDNFREIAGLGVEDREGALRVLADWTHREGARLAATLARRRSDGFVRECHGDLHLGNVVLFEGAVLPFDAIEFSPGWRWIDVMSDVAFATMDLAAHGCDGAAARFLDRYLEASGDYGGLATLRFFEVYRAMVRAKIAAIRGRQDGIAPREGRRAAAAFDAYVALAGRLARPGAATVVLMRGLSGSGKSVASARLADALGAVRVRSDVERKRLHGLPARARTRSPVGGGAYSAQSTAATYGRLLALAHGVLESGRPVVVDAAFLRHRDRAAFRGLAEACGATFAIASCEAPEATLRARVAARGRAGVDASEADLAVLAAQVAAAEPLTPDERAHATVVRTDSTAQPARVLEALAARLKAGR